jgi:hypothetical protein
MTISLHYFVSFSLDSVTESQSGAHNPEVKDKPNENKESKGSEAKTQLGSQSKVRVLFNIYRHGVQLGRRRRRRRRGPRSRRRVDRWAALDDIAPVFVGQNFLSEVERMLAIEPT